MLVFRHITVIALVFWVSCCQPRTFGADKAPAYLTAEEGGADFGFQGEYVGSVGSGGAKRTIAAQVLALGNGAFEGILYDGGLPGAGWNEKIRFHFRGTANGPVVDVVGIYGERLMFDNPNLRGTIQNNVFRGVADMFRNRVPSGEFEMHKTLRESPTLGAKPPKNALVLFDGTNADEWVNGQIVDGNLLNVGTKTKRSFGSHRLHLEFRTPFMPTAIGMGRGNSGVYLLDRWEVQVIDSFGWNTENRKFERLSDFGRCAGIHEVAKPMVNMCFPPLSWQTYDIDFETAQFDADGKRTSPAMLTVVHNGVTVHDRSVLPPYEPGDKELKSLEREPGPIQLQQHGNPVRYRNIWIVPRD